MNGGNLLTLTQMLYFREVCERHGVTAAAEAAHVSQPTVSNAIRELEREFQVSLFTRYNKQLLPTEEGTFFYTRVCGILDAAAELECAMRDFGGHARRLRIGVPPMVGTFLFPDMLAGFRAFRPEAQVEIQEYGSVKTLELLEDGALDLAVVAVDDAGAARFFSLPLLDSQMVFCVSRRHPLAERERLSLPELAGEPLVLMKNDTYHARMVLRGFQDAGLSPHVLLRTEQLYTIQQYILRGEAGGFLLREVADMNPEIVGIPLSPLLPIHIRLLWNQSRQIPNSVAQFLRFARDYQPRFGLTLS